MTAGVDRLRHLLTDTLPEYASSEIRCLGSGMDHAAYLVGNELIVRLVHHHDDGAATESAQAGERDQVDETEREARLLRLVGRCATLPVPVPLAVGAGLLAYRALPGVPALSLSVDWRRAHSAHLGDTLGRFLASLRAIPADRLAGTAEHDAEPMSAWLADARECWAAIIGYRAVTTGGPLQNSLAKIEKFLAQPPPAAGNENYFSHNDLGAEHVLVDPTTGDITGVIDWTDAAITDPAADLGLILRDLGDTALAGAARQLVTGDPEARRERAVFYARCRSLEDIAFGMQNDRPEYLTNGIGAVERLFAGGPAATARTRRPTRGEPA